MSQKIGIFDSGIGGLTVMHAIRKACPLADIFYFGDTARLPYGDKSRDTVKQYAIENCSFLLSQGVELLIAACNTATAFALDTLQELFDIPVIGVVEPGAQRAAATTRNGRIAVIGTKGTIDSKAYEREIYRVNSRLQVISQACPLFVPLVEEGWSEHPATYLVVKEYIAPLLDAGVDTLVLGCTHYPILAPLIQHYCGESVVLVDSASTCASRVKVLLGRSRQQNHLPITKYFVSDDPEKFRHMGTKLLKFAIDEVEMADLSHKTSHYVGLKTC